MGRHDADDAYDGSSDDDYDQNQNREVIIEVRDGQTNNAGGGKRKRKNRNIDSSISKEGSRNNFIRKVYGILAMQLLLTIAFTCMCMFIKPVNKWFVHNAWIMYVGLVGYIIIAFVLICFPKTAKKVPTNYILLFVLTFFMSLIVGTICAIYEKAGLGYLVLLAVVITTVMVIGLTIYACVTTSDITMWGGILFCISIGLLIFGILAIIIQSYILYIAICCLSAILSCIYIVYDTQLLLGNKKYSLSEDEYIIGALMLYIDIITLFLDLLEILTCVAKQKYRKKFY